VINVIWRFETGSEELEDEGRISMTKEEGHRRTMVGA
jgi:hypothetical protein